eukprot:scaffold26500_cov93-Skeletonema_dohrnii-CCMP3373.AAC.3
MQSLETILVHANITILPAFFSTYLALLYVYMAYGYDYDNSCAVDYDYDYDNNTALYYACRGAKYETIAMLHEISLESLSLFLLIFCFCWRAMQMQWKIEREKATNTLRASFVF